MDYGVMLTTCSTYYDGVFLCERALNCRHRIHGNMLYIRHTKVTDRGTYRCIIVRLSGKLETADAPLGLYGHCVISLFSSSSH